MTVSTLITKVMLPRRRADVLTRERLLNRLYDAVDRKLVLVSAPAGYGKTTLLVDFAHDLEHPVCWYALDQSDHDPRVFLEHLILSLEHRFPEFGARTRRALEANPDLSSGAPGVVDALINEMVDEIPRWFVMVLDDYHRLGEAHEVGAILGRLLTYQTDQFLLIVSSRDVPRLPQVIQLTARREVEGLGREELAFRSKEIQLLLVQNYNLDVPEKQAAEIAAQSEGWITGIVLTAHTMWHGVLKGLAQAHESGQPVYEYLAQEVFELQDPEVQTFLKESSILQEMSPQLCDEILGREGSEGLLKLLVDRNLFVINLEGEWHRYHHLFQEYLEAKLKADAPDRWTELHRLAAKWFEARGQPEVAIHHYLAVSAYEDASHLMVEAARDVFVSGRTETLMSWGNALQPKLRERMPRLALFQSRAAYNLGRGEESLQLIAEAERGYRAAGDDFGLSYAMLHRCQIWQDQGRFREALQLGEQALVLVEEASVPVSYEAHRVIGQSHLGLGQLIEAESHLKQSLELCEKQGNDYDKALILGSLADCLWKRGEWAEAIAVQAQSVTIRRQLGNAGRLASTLNDLGFYLYATGEWRDALLLLEEALTLARQAGHRRTEAYALISLGELCRDLEDLERAETLLIDGLAVADDVGQSFLSAYGREALGLTYRRQGDYAAARAAIEQAIEIAHTQNSEFQLGRYRASLGLVLAEGGDSEVGVETLLRAHESLEKIDARAELARAQFFAAWALYLSGREAEAIMTLQQFSSLQELPGWAFFMTVEGDRASPLLAHAREKGVASKALAPSEGETRRLREAAQEVLHGRATATADTQRSVRILGFGVGRVERDREEIPISDWGGAAPRRLLLYVLIHCPCLRDQIAAEFWPQMPASKVKTAFHTTKFRLKRAIGQEPLFYDGTSYRLHPDFDYWFDVQEFQELLNDPGTGRRVEQLQRATDLYQGDFFEDCYDDWCIRPRARLREQFLDALEELAGRLVARRQYKQAIDKLRRGLEVDDLRESLHRQLMMALALSGQRSRAIGQFQTCEEALERELGTSPSPETVDLHMRIRDGLPLD
jgi:ATP/maltotriose-dependent transcriptional regulator MalT/DNA-binding SARP family transcriptional activator